MDESTGSSFVSSPWGPADALARLAAGAAHELNNPLSVVVGYLSLINSGQTPEAQLHVQLQRVAEEAQQCRVVTRGLAELAESALGTHELLEWRDLLEEARAALGEPAPLVVSFSGDPRPLRGQAQGLARLLSHGIQNAVAASARSLRMKLTHGPAVTTLELRDDGLGMSEQVLARAREPFFTTKPGRLGLGLAICDAVAWAHRGALALSSRVGRGTTLTLTLPSEGGSP